MALYDSLGALIATNNPDLETTGFLSTNLTAGTYYLQIKPTGVGNPLIDPPTGYVLYGSLGQYDVRIVPPGGIKALPCFTGVEDGGLGIWMQSGSDDMDWTRREDVTPSSSTGPSGASGGNFYLYTEASSHNNETAILETPRFNLSTSVVPSLIFDYHMYGAAMGSLSVDVYDGIWHEDIWIRSGQQNTSEADPWETALIDLSAFAGKKDVVVRLRGITGSSYTSDMAIDNIRLSLDIDADELPDSWEFQYFGNITSAVATIDIDNDGFDNLSEYISGHDPTNASSFFAITNFSATATNGPSFIISWDSVAGRVYGVDWSDQLNNTFTNISGDLPYPSGSYTDAVERAGSQQFYRIEVRTGP